MALALCAVVVVAGALEQLAGNRPAYAENFAPRWVPLAAVGLAAAGLMPFNGSPLWLRVRQMLRWGGLLLMVWTASGLPLDLLRIVPGLMPPGVDWPGLATRTLALAAAVVLASLALARPDAPASSWYGYAAFVLALPCPVLRTCWSLVAKLATGGDPGLEGIAVWVPGLFYGSWLLRAIAACAATRSYQLRSAALRMPLPPLAGTTCAVN